MHKDKSEILFCLKGISCLSVVIIHSLSFVTLKYDDLFIKLCCFAAPVFYFVTGFFSYNLSIEKISIRIKKTILYGVYCFVLYIFLDFIISIKFFLKGFEEGINYLLNIFQLRNVIDSLSFGSLPNVWKPGWYIIGMIWTYLFWFFIKKRKKEDMILKLTFAFFIIGISLIIVLNTFLNGFGSFIFIGRSLPWFLEGIVIRSKIENENLIVNNKFVMVSGIIGYFLSIIPQQFGLKIKFDYLGTSIYSICVILLFLNNSEKLYNNFLSDIGKKYSSKIYIYHMIIITIISKIISPSLYNNVLIIKIIYVLLCLSITIYFAYILSNIISNSKEKQ